MYCSKILLTTLLALFCLLGAPLGCASNTAKPDQPSASSQAQALEPAADIFARYAAYMPDDTAAVAIVRTDLATTLMQEIFYSPDPDKGPKHLVAMRADFSELLLSTYGVDPLSADFGVLVVTPSAPFLLLEGNIKTNFKSDNPIEAHGLTAHYISADPSATRRGVWVSVLPDTGSLAVFIAPQLFERVASIYANKAQGLAQTPKAKVLQQLFANAAPSAITGAITLDGPLKQRVQGQLPFTPDAMSFNIGSELRVEVLAEASELDSLQNIVETTRASTLEPIDAAYQNRQNHPPAEAALWILNYHLSQHVNDNLEITRTPHSLAISSPIPLGLGAVAAVGAASAIAIPGFLRYIKNSKAAEAQSILNTLQRRVTQYYEEHSADGTCTLPPAANPVPADVPCCDGVGPSNGEKWTAPAETWEQEGWKALSFSLEEPTYFAYQMLRRTPPGGPELMTLLAFADFVPGGRRHTVSLTLISRKDDTGQCTLITQPPVVLHEFE